MYLLLNKQQSYNKHNYNWRLIRNHAVYCIQPLQNAQ